MNTIQRTVKAMQEAVSNQEDDYRTQLEKFDLNPDYVAGFLTRLAAGSQAVQHGDIPIPVLAGALTMAFGLGLEFHKIIADPAFGLPAVNPNQMHTDDLRGERDR